MSILDRRAFLAAAGASAAVPFSACAQEAEGGWTPRASLPWAVQEIYGTAVEGMIVVAGGLRLGEDRTLVIEDRVGMYLAAEDRWLEGLRLPAPRHHPMVIGLEGQAVWAIGGYGRGPTGDWTSMTEVWRTGPDGWVADAALPGPQAEAVGVGHDGRLHLITGRAPTGEANGQWNDQADIDAHRVFTPGGGWETARPCPMARNSAAASVLDGAIWVAGGRTVGGGGTGRLDRYDPRADRWDTLAPIPPSPETGQQVGGGLAMAAISGRLVAFGGEWFQRGGGGGVFRETWIYDPKADRWEAGPPMRTPRHGLAAAAVDGTVYAIAGGEVVSGGRAGGVVEALIL